MSSAKEYGAQESIFSEIKYRLLNKNTGLTEHWTLAQLVGTTFRRGQFGFRGRWTGLKDKNGVEIYEGDIIDVYSKGDGSHYIRRKVTFEQRPPACGFVLGDATSDYIEHFGRIMKDDDDEWDIEVIGNVYEHEHLLGDKHA